MKPTKESNLNNNYTYTFSTKFATYRMVQSGQQLYYCFICSFSAALSCESNILFQTCMDSASRAWDSKTSPPGLVIVFNFFNDTTLQVCFR